MTTGPSAKRLTSIEPVTGWRVWRLHFDDGGFVLRSIIREDAWPAGEPMRARCSKHRGFAVPSVHCACGIYAADSPESLARSSACSQRTSVVGAVAVWGTVIEHETGTRSRFAYPARLRLVCAPCLASGLGAVEPSIVEPVGTHWVAHCPRHVQGTPRPASRSASEVQSELLAAYTVDLLPLERIARGLVVPASRRSDPRPDIGATLERGVELVFMGIGLVINAIGVLMIVGWVVSMILIAGAVLSRLFSR